MTLSAEKNFDNHDNSVSQQYRISRYPYRPKDELIQREEVSPSLVFEQNIMQEPFPTVYWPAWDADATFDAGDGLPPESAGRLWAVLMFVFYGDKVALADIEGRGLTIPSGRIEPGETVDEAAVREAWEETGANLDPNRRRLIGCYRLTPRAGTHARQTRYCPVFVAEAFSFSPIPEGSESRGLVLAAWEDVADLYFTWDPLMAEVFEFAQDRKETFFPAGIPVSSLTG